jgi:hypothetical protein
MGMRAVHHAAMHAVVVMHVVMMVMVPMMPVMMMVAMVVMMPMMVMSLMVHIFRFGRIGKSHCRRRYGKGCRNDGCEKFVFHEIPLKDGA